MHRIHPKLFVMRTFLRPRNHVMNSVIAKISNSENARGGSARIPRLLGSGGTLLKCPACRLTCLSAAVGEDGNCPCWGHDHLVRVGILSGYVGRTTTTTRAAKPVGDRN
jgi:hypothetical protein